MVNSLVVFRFFERSELEGWLKTINISLLGVKTGGRSHDNQLLSF